MTPTYQPGNLQWLGLAKETTPGTPIATPTIWVPVDNPTWSPKVTVLTDQALRGSMATDYQQVAGMRYDEVAYNTYLYADSVFPHLLAMLGNPDTVTGASDPYTHKTAVYNGASSDGAQPKTWTVFHHQPGTTNKVMQVPGCQLTDLKLSIKADSLPTMSATWNGLPGTYITPPSNTPSTLLPMPPWTAAITVGGVPLTQYSDIELDYKRGTKPIPVLNGTQSPLAIYAGELSATGTLTAVYQGYNDVNLVDFLANTQPGVSVTIYPQGDATHVLTFQHSKVAFDNADPKGGMTGWMELTAPFKALANATDALGGGLSPVQIQYLSSQSSAF